MADQYFIEEGYYTPTGYFAYIAEAQVDATFYIDPGYIDFSFFEERGSWSELTATGVVNPITVVLADAALVSDFVVNVTPTRIVEIPTSVVTWDDTITWEDWYGTYWEPQDFLLNLQATIQVAGVVETVETGSAQLFSEFSVTVIGTEEFTGVVNIESTTSVLVLGVREQFSNVNLAAEFALVSDAQRQRLGAVASDSIFVLDGLAEKTALANSQLESTFTQTTIGTKATETILTVFSDLTLEANANIIASASTDISVNTAVDTTGIRIQSAEASTQGIFGLDIILSKVVAADAVLSSLFDLSADSQRARTATAETVSNFEFFTVPERQRTGTAQIANEFTVDLQGQAEFGTQIDLPIQFGFDALSQRDVLVSLALDAFAIQVSVGEIIRLDPNLVIKVLPESRVILADSETRIIDVLSETRKFTAESETRTVKVLAETRTLT